MTDDVMSIGAVPRKTNGQLMADMARLGWLDGHVLDCTYGLGLFWSDFMPDDLTACDMDADKSPVGHSVDFTRMPDGWAESFDTVVFDPPYMLNGTQGLYVDADRYGVSGKVPIHDRHRLMFQGFGECVRVCKPGGRVIVKCQAQNASNRFYRQPSMVVGWALSLDMKVLGEMHVQGWREQPGTQVNPRNDYSTAVIVRKPRRGKPRGKE